MPAVDLLPAFLPLRPGCVLDGALALGPFGLRMAAALCADVEVWIPRRLHRTLRDPDSLDRVDQLVPRYWAAGSRDLNPARAVEAARAELRRWFRRLREPALASLPLRALNDQADECALPPGVDAGLHQRTEELEAGLQAVADRSGYDLPRGRFVIEHTVDAIALCAALAPTPAVVLTRMDPDGYREPALASYLRAWGVQVSQVPGGGGRAAAQFRHVIARAGLLPLRWAGVRLIAMYVAVPDARLFGNADPPLETGPAAAVWKQATCHWHEV